MGLLLVTSELAVIRPERAERLYNAGVSKRESGFLLIGFGVGLLFAMAPILGWVWFHHMFIVRFAWQPSSIVLTLPIALLVVGGVLSRRGPRRAGS